MKIAGLDHLVLTTGNLDACLKFYSEVLDMEIMHKDNRYALHFGNQKINLHTKPAEFLPAASNPQVGSLDICLVVDEPIENAYRELVKKGATLETDIVERHGALGKIKSIYLRDPDGNLIELCSYGKREKISEK